MKLLQMIFVLLVTVSVTYAGDKGSIYKQNALKVMNTFMYTLQHNDFEKSSQKIVPLMHKSLLTRNGKSLDDDTYRYSFKKAHMNAKNYKYPIKVTRVQKLRTSGVGYGDTYQKGIEYKFWIAKKQSIAGLPAPLVLFFPKGEKIPKLSYIGSL
jgi:hypothetical protein